MPFPIFLSSLGEELSTLRKAIFREAGGGELIYVDEQLYVRDIFHQDDLLLADELLMRIEQADTFVCILAGNRHGSLVRSGNKMSAVSFFEIELFFAALRRKTIHILVRDDFEPEPNLRILLEMLHFAFPGWKSQKGLKHQEIIDEAKRIADSVSSRQHISLSINRIWTPVKRIAQAFYIGRGRTGLPLQFLNPTITIDRHPPRSELVEQLLNADNFIPNQQQRLSRLWLAIRELNTTPVQQMEDPIQLELFENVLQKWSGAGAWYGLHADMPLGCLAAVNTINAIRERRRDLGSLSVDEQSYPAGALASVKYSAAKNLLSLRDRRVRLLDALNDINIAHAQSIEDKSGILAVRGSIHRSLGHVFASLSDHEESLRIRYHQNAPSETIGEVMVELGFACIYTLQLRRALRLCEEGVERMQNKATGGNMARALRKLAIAYAVNGKPVKSRDTQALARSIALEARAMDQLR